MFTGVLPAIYMEKGFKNHRPPVDLNWFFEISIRTE